MTTSADDGAGRSAPPSVEVLLARLHDVVATARTMPLSTSVLVNRDEVLDLVEAVQAQLPDELRQSRWLLKDREELLSRARREADEILQAARTRAERMVQRTEITREAERAARAVLEAAEIRAREMHHEVEDLVDQKLAAFEDVLARTMRQIHDARDQLQVPGAPPAVSVDPGPTPYDQDHDRLDRTRPDHPTDGSDGSDGSDWSEGTVGPDGTAGTAGAAGRWHDVPAARDAERRGR